MPTTLVGLLIFVTLLVPGFAYTAQYGARHTVEKPSAFRETAVLTVRSVTADSFALLVFGVCRWLAPGWTLDVGALIRSPAGYSKVHYLEVFGWGIGLLVLATIFAIALGSIPSTPRFALLMNWLDSHRVTKVIAHLSDGNVNAKPAWWRIIIDERPVGSSTYLSVTLTDDTLLAGYVGSFSPDTDETADRELTLIATVSEPLKIRVQGTQEAVDMMGQAAVIVSARQIKYVVAAYINQ